MVEFMVRVPSDTPPGPLFLAGDGDRFGNWRAAGVHLEHWGDGTFRTRLDFPTGDPSRFLVTRGHWRRAESDGADRERAPRWVTAGTGSVLDVHVVGWGRSSVRYHPGFASRHVRHSRTISVYLPPGYDLEPGRRFPVLYLQDGQNLFDAETAFAGVPWGVDETTERAVRAGCVEPLIIVGVANSPDRLGEYGPRAEPEHPEDLTREYTRFLVEEVKPFVDREYRTLTGPADTGVGGSSMGGLISLHLCKTRPDVFGRCAAMSPSLWWDEADFLRSFSAEPGWLASCRIWLDMGGREGATNSSRRGNLRRARALARLLGKAGLRDGREFHYYEDLHGGHDEAAWGWRFEPMLRFLFPPPSRPSACDSPGDALP